MDIHQMIPAVEEPFYDFLRAIILQISDPDFLGNFIFNPADVSPSKSESTRTY
jgi:hypothetical protein